MMESWLEGGMMLSYEMCYKYWFIGAEIDLYIVVNIRKQLLG
jgi:hypothetical protein